MEKAVQFTGLGQLDEIFGVPVRDSNTPISVVHLLSQVKFPPKCTCCKVLSCRNSTFSIQLPSTGYSADMHCIYKSNVPFIDPENVIRGKTLQIIHCGPIQVSSSSYVKDNFS